MGLYDFVRNQVICCVYMHLMALSYSYGRLNGVHTSENKWLLNDLLRKEWGFDGVVISDWYLLLSLLHVVCC